MPNFRMIGFQLVGLAVAVLLTYLAVKHFVATGDIVMSRRLSPWQVQQRVLALSGLLSLLTGPVGIVLATILTGGHFAGSSKGREIPPEPTIEAVPEAGELQFEVAPYRLLYRSSLSLRLALAFVMFLIMMVATFASGTLLYGSVILGVSVLVLFGILSQKVRSFRLDPSTCRLLDPSGRALSAGRSARAKFVAVLGQPLEYWEGSRSSRRKIHQLVVCVVTESGGTVTLGLEDRSARLEQKLRQLAHELEVPCYLGPKDTRYKVVRTPTGVKFLAKPNPLMVWKSENEHEVRER